MFWPVVTVVVAELIIIAFLIPVFAAIIFGAEIARYFAEAHKRMRPAEYMARRAPLPIKTSGPVCPWEPRGNAHAR